MSVSLVYHSRVAVNGFRIFYHLLIIDYVARRLIRLLIWPAIFFKFLSWCVWFFCIIWLLRCFLYWPHVVIRLLSIARLTHGGWLSPILALLSSIDIATDITILIKIEVKVSLVIIGAQAKLITSNFSLGSIFESRLGAGGAWKFLLLSLLSPLTLVSHPFYWKFNRFLLRISRSPFILLCTSLKGFSWLAFSWMLWPR